MQAMEVLTAVLQWYNMSVIHNLFISLLSVKLLSYISPKEIYIVSKDIICGLIILGSFTNVIYWILDALFSEEITLSSRATGPYAAAYWLMIVFSCILPLVLLFKNIRRKGRVIFIIALLLNIGWIFGRFLIIVISFHRDYLPSSWSMYGPFTPLITVFINGVAIGTIITCISLFISSVKKTDANQSNQMNY
jgi:hypothetical protein